MKIRSIQLHCEPHPNRFTLIQPLSLHISAGCGLVLWQQVKPSSENNSLEDRDDELLLQQQFTACKSELTSYMQAVEQLLRNYQLHVPMVALIELQEDLKTDTARLQHQLKALEGAQDWHRGRFVVNVIYGKDRDKMLVSWCSEIEFHEYHVKKMSASEFREQIEDKKNDIASADNVDELLLSFANAVQSKLVEDKCSEVVSSWAESLQAHINHNAQADIIS